jgi:hypothetical protein
MSSIDVCLLDAIAPLHFLPQITDDTYDVLLQELGMKSDHVLDALEAGQSLSAMTEEVIRELVQTHRRFGEMLFQSLRRVCGEEYVRMNRYTEGLALVWRAYHINTGYHLLQALQGFAAENMGSLQHRLVQSLIGANAPTYFERAFTLIPIPQEQVNLHRCLYQASKLYPSSSQREILAGAEVMYDLLRYLWPRLFPVQGAHGIGGADRGFLPHAH